MRDEEALALLPSLLVMDVAICEADCYRHRLEFRPFLLVSWPHTSQQDFGCPVSESDDCGLRAQAHGSQNQDCNSCFWLPEAVIAVAGPGGANF